METNEIVNAVISYVRDENAKYAILIDGARGSGKTYLYENYLVDAVNSIELGKNERKYNVYISLYGVSTIASLAKQLLTNYLIYVKCQGNEIAKKWLKPLAGIIGVASNAFSFSHDSVSIDFSGMLEKIESNIAVKDMVICFDDLERCTIPINEFFGFANNLIEHCNCKVLILADEKNIGKIYANTNVEKKYQTVLTGDRKIVEYIGDGREYSRNKNALGKNPNGEITVEELKKLNEILYSENYLYKDIKEKVIGKTMFYYPMLKDMISELINGNDKSKGIVQDSKYKEYLVEHIDRIVSAFNETKNRNMRIVKMWLLAFRKIYDITTKYYSNNKYYEDILEEFLRYSIWVASALKQNKKIIHSANHGNQELVYYEGNEYTYIFRYSFIDAWIHRDVWNDADLSQSCRSIIKRKEREDVDNPPKIHSTGTELAKLTNWRLMEDEQVRFILGCLEKEIEENKYAYYDYSNILTTLLFLQEKGLYVGNIEKIRDIMIDLIKVDNDVQEENDFPKEFSSEVRRNKYNELYSPIAEEREKRNREINKEDQEEADIYGNANAFYEHCCKMENYYLSHRSFVEYLNLEKFKTLINASNNEELDTIRHAFKTIYHMGNLKDFYMADIEGLKTIRRNLLDEKVVKQEGIIRKIALESFAEAIKRDLILLGVDEDQM